MRNVRNNRGITLVVLIVTILVLLILVGISISSLISNQGIFVKTQNAVRQKQMQEGKEELTMCLMDSQLDVALEGTSINSDAYYESLRTHMQEKIELTNNYNNIETGTGEILFEKVTAKKGGFNYKITSTLVINLDMNDVENGETNESNSPTIPQDMTYVIKYEGLENSNFATENPNPINYKSDTDTFALTNPTKKGYVFLGWVGTGVNEASRQVSINKGSSGDRVYVALWTADSIIYPSGKSLDTLENGEDISFNGEKFKVINTTSTQIITMPYYNITLDRKYPEQNYSNSNGKTKFSSSNTYSSGDIPMSESTDNVQKHINAYSNLLHSIDPRVSARIARYSELKGMTGTMRNPGQQGTFWLGTAFSSSGWIYRVGSSGELLTYNYNTEYESHGVRPLVIFSKF